MLEGAFVSNMCVARQLGLPLAAVWLAGLWGCAGVAPSDPPSPVAERSRGNATVRAAVYVEAASNVAAPMALVASDSASTSKSAPARGKQDKRQQVSKKDNKRTAVAAPAKQAAAASDNAARSIDQKVPVSATGYRYTYSIELDGGGTKTFGFATDQGLLVGDRVTVSDTGVTLVPK